MGPRAKSGNSRRWTITELSAFAEVLADPENVFASTLDKLALKKSSNNEVFECIQNEFILKMATEDLKAANAQHFRNGKVSKLDIGIDKLRVKYKWLKTEWAQKTRRAKNGSGLDPDKEPRWYQILNPVFSETHQPLNLVSRAADTSFLNSSDEEEEEEDDTAVGVAGLNPPGRSRNIGFG